MRIQVFSGNGMRAVLAELIPRFERAQGHTVEVGYEPAQIVLRRIDNGEAADIALLGAEAIEHLIERGHLVAASRRVLASNGIGVAVRKGAAPPDIATTEGLVRALRAAQSVAYTSEGASGIYFADLIDRLGIGAEVRAKARTQAGGLVGELIVSGDAELAIQQLPELLAVPGIDVIGPLPDAVQRINTTVAGVFTRSPSGEAASSFVRFLAGPVAREVFRDKGFEPAV